jgi:hypothetical protein
MIAVAFLEWSKYLVISQSEEFIVNNVVDISESPTDAVIIL